MAKKEESAKKTKEVKKAKNTKKSVKKDSYIRGLQKELALVKWPGVREVVKYTISTIVFCLFICGFFLLLDLLMSFIKGTVA